VFVSHLDRSVVRHRVTVATAMIAMMIDVRRDMGLRAETCGRRQRRSMAIDFSIHDGGPNMKPHNDSPDRGILDIVGVGYLRPLDSPSLALYGAVWVLI